MMGLFVHYPVFLGLLLVLLIIFGILCKTSFRMWTVFISFLFLEA